MAHVLEPNTKKSSKYSMWLTVYTADLHNAIRESDK